MYEYYFMFGSQTDAQDAFKLLQCSDVPCRSLSAPKPLQFQGCAYCVSVGSGHYIRSKDEFDRLCVPYRQVFCRLPDGTFEEVEM